MSNLLFATPWYLLLTLVVVGGIVARTGNQKQQAGTRNVGLGLVALAVVLFAVSFFVETDLERVKRLNRELVQAVPNHDWSKFGELLDPNASLRVLDATLFSSRAALIAAAKADADRWGVRSVTVTRTDEQAFGKSSITVDVDVLSRQDSTESFGMPTTPSSWKMSWENDGAGWHCRQITCLRIGGEDGPAAARFIRP